MVFLEPTVFPEKTEPVVPPVLKVPSDLVVLSDLLVLPVLPVPKESLVVRESLENRALLVKMVFLGHSP